MMAMVKTLVLSLAASAMIASPTTDPAAFASGCSDPALGTGSKSAQVQPVNNIFEVSGQAHHSSNRAQSPSRSISRDECSDGPKYAVEPVCGNVGGTKLMNCDVRIPCGNGGHEALLFELDSDGEHAGDGKLICIGERGSPVDVAAFALQELRRIPLPASRPIIQPPGGRTLVNFDTIFSTEAAPLTRTVTVAGLQVELRIWASSFVWHHGDGTTQTSSEPGVKYASGRPMSDYVSHQYVDAQVTVQPRVDTTYSARFRVNGGAWQDVAGTVTIPGTAVELRVVEAQPQLVAGD